MTIEQYYNSNFRSQNLTAKKLNFVFTKRLNIHSI